MCATIEETFISMKSAVFKGFTDEELDQALWMLNKIVANMKGMQQD